MSVWSTKSLADHQNYIVLKHTVPGVNHTINGVKFRAGYAVVSKPSKTYTFLKRLPVLKNAREFPITYLQKLPFITRSIDIKVVYGIDVYYSYQKAMEVKTVAEDIIQKEEEIKQHLADDTKCQVMITDPRREGPCGHPAVENSGGFCGHHILQSPVVAELGIEIPKFLTKQEKKELRNKTVEKIQNLKRAK